MSPPQILQRDVADDERDADREQHLREMVLAGAAEEEAVDEVAEHTTASPPATSASAKLPVARATERPM